MKHIITAIIFTGLLMSCNSTDKTKTTVQDSDVTETTTETTPTETNKT
ncbi:hypothetical protein ADIWIN_3154 [Winogradskyella psychrotolerans RS-3]|uniref:Uncharacterized protein n=1 Tax=Winogradskyella psychrotolerans RS-3 TaxID=641526 RepID=S7VPG6_9FLAO|nr:hypothetical protein ADIWIN_3154 [Winogradskyella psychrotolerans RS-3]